MVFTLLQAAVFATATNASGIELPDIGDADAGVATPLEEYRTGEAVVRNIRRAGGILEDQLLDNYLNHLGYQLVSSGSPTSYQFHFFVVKDPAINAFALPGGFIGINYGLILATNSESELASVVAHEISHVTQRHHARAYALNSKSNIPMLAALIAAVVVGSQNSEAGQALLAGTVAGSAQQQINFIRSNEKEADRVGIDLLATAGYDPDSMASFFEKLDRNSRLYGGANVPEFLRTHPVTENRIAEARSRARQYQGQLKLDQKNYQLMRARLRVITTTEPQKKVKEIADNLKSGSYLDKDAERYAYALALLQVGKPTAAQQQLKPLLRKDPGRIAYILAGAQIEVKAGKLKKAVKTYQKALSNYPDNPVLTFGYAETLIQSGNYRQAKKLLDKFLRNPPPPHPDFYKLQAETETRLGLSVQAHQSLANYYYLIGQTHEAINQLTLALKNRNIDFYEQSRLEARMREWKQELALLQQK